MKNRKNLTEAAWGPILSLFVFVIVLVATNEITAQTLEGNTPQDDKKKADAAFAQLIAFAPEYEIRPTESKETFKLVEEPLLRWSNPLRATWDGGVFLWTHQGRPATAMCAYWSNDQEFEHEFQSLHATPVTGELNGDTKWVPEQAGIEYKPAPDAPRVSSRRSIRLVQMRSIASKFKGTTGHVHKPLEPLRLLREPLYRYPKQVEANGVIDGAVFALVQATDPEILVIIEARKGETRKDKTEIDDAKWYVGFARMSVVAQFVEYKDRVYWQCKWGTWKKPSSTYFKWSFEAPPGIEPGLGKGQRQN